MHLLLLLHTWGRTSVWGLQAPEARPGAWSSFWETSNLIWSSQDFTARDIVFRDLHQQLMLSSFSRVNAPSQRGTFPERYLWETWITRIIMCSFKAVAHSISLMPFVPLGLKFCDSKPRFQNSKNIFSLWKPRSYNLMFWFLTRILCWPKYSHKLKVESYFIWWECLAHWSPRGSISVALRKPLQGGRSGSPSIYTFATKETGSLNIQDQIKLRNLAFCVWEDAGLWAHWIDPFHRLLSYLGPILFPCSYSFLHSPSSSAITMGGGVWQQFPEPSSPFGGQKSLKVVTLLVY